jgi:hypothetical protein
VRDLLNVCDKRRTPMEFRTMRATRLSVANFNTTLSSDSFDTGTGSSNSFPSANESFSVHNSARDNRNTRLRGRFRAD